MSKSVIFENAPILTDKSTKTYRLMRCKEKMAVGNQLVDASRAKKRACLSHLRRTACIGLSKMARANSSGFSPLKQAGRSSGERDRV